MSGVVMARKRSGWNTHRGEKIAQLVALTYGTNCWLCHQPIIGKVSPDHVIPVALGGSDDIENLRPAHLLCNKRRGMRPPPPQLLNSTRW